MCIRDSHLIVHTCEKPFKCCDCLTFYSTKTELSLHKKTHLPTELRLKFNCSKCPETFKTAKGLVGHNVLRHNEGKVSELSCTICEKVFGTKCDLKKHVK